MSKWFGLCLVLGSLVPGCYINASENGDQAADDAQDDGSECASGHAPKPTPASDGGASCKTHTDCGGGQFCLIGSGQCTPAQSCAKEADCLSGFNCDAATKTCLPSASETCAEVAEESACLAREDCAPTYAGVDCTCGPDCKCQGGEPGCVCASFEFFRCETVLP